MQTILLIEALESERVEVEPRHGYRFVVEHTGLGKTQAIVGLLSAVSRHRPAAVVNLGTSGSAALPVGTIAVCRSFVDRDMKLLADYGACWSLEAEAECELTDVICSGEPRRVCSTGDRFVTDSLPDGDVCDMEAFAMASLCRHLGLPFVSVKYVTDIVGQNSLKAWADKLHDARLALADFMQKKLGALVPDVNSKQSKSSH